MKANLARFYGWTNSEISSLKLSVAQEYYTAISVIRDSETSRLAVASSVSNMKKEARDKYFKDLNKSTKLVKSDSSGKVLSVEEAAKKMARAMING